MKRSIKYIVAIVIIMGIYACMDKPKAKTSSEIGFYIGEVDGIKLYQVSAAGKTCILARYGTQIAITY